MFFVELVSQSIFLSTPLSFQNFGIKLFLAVSLSSQCWMNLKSCPHLSFLHFCLYHSQKRFVYIIYISKNKFSRLINPFHLFFCIIRTCSFFKLIFTFSFFLLIFKVTAQLIFYSLFLI